MEIGTLIKEKRVEKGLTMKQLADKMGVSEGTVSRWESGDIENIKRKKIAELSKVLDISIYVLMGWPEPKKSPSSLRSDEQELLEEYNLLDIEDRNIIRGEIKGMLRNIKYKKDIEAV